MFRTKLQSLRTEDKHRIAVIIDGHLRNRQRSRKTASPPSYNVTFENGVSRSKLEIEALVNYWRSEWQFCHKNEPDVSTRYTPTHE